MASIDEAIEVSVPTTVAYDQWTQFEQFPRFMEGVRAVRQIDPTRLHWDAEVAGHRHEWDAEITEQVPDRVVAWRSTEGYRNDGRVRFEPLSENRTRIHLHIDHEPEGIGERIGEWLGLAAHRAKGDLTRFREMIEARGTPTGTWRGEVHGGAVAATDPGESRTAPVVAPPPGADGPVARTVLGGEHVRGGDDVGV